MTCGFRKINRLSICRHELARRPNIYNMLVINDFGAGGGNRNRRLYAVKSAIKRLFMGDRLYRAALNIPQNARNNAGKKPEIKYQ